jgi:hypothetical protein
MLGKRMPILFGSEINEIKLYATRPIENLQFALVMHDSIVDIMK